MQTQEHKKIGSSGHGVHVCHKCGWTFPNSHPSSKQRRSHKKICGTIEGYKLGSSEESNPNLKADDDEVNTSPSNGLKMVEKAAEMTVSLSSRSDEDVYSDAKTDFGDPPAVAGYVAVRERAVVMQDLSDDVGENLVAGDLYPPNIDDDTPPLNVECSRPENERLVSDVISQLQPSRSALDSVSNSSSNVEEASVSESTLQCSKVDSVQDTVEKGNLEAVLGKNSEDVANQSSENVSQTSEEILCSQKVNGDSMPDEFGDNNDFSKEDYFDGEISSSRNGTSEMATSEDLTNVPSESTVTTVKAVSVPHLVTVDSLEYFPASSVMEVTADQGGEFDAEIDDFPKADIVEQINGTEETTVVEAGSSLDASVIPDYLTSKEYFRGGVIDDSEDQKTEKLPDDVTLNPSQEVEYVDHGIYEKSEEVEPSKSQNKNTEDMISATLDQEDYCADANKMEGHPVDADMSGSISAAVCQDEDKNENGRNSLVVSDTNLHSVLDDGGNLTHSINNVKPVHTDSEHAEKEVQLFDALEADSNRVEEEKLPQTTDGAVDYVARSAEVEENLSVSPPTVAQSEYQMDDKVEVRRDAEHGSAPFASVQNSETEVNLVSSNQLVGEERVNLLDTDANLTEDAVFLNKATNFVTRQDEEVVEGEENVNLLDTDANLTEDAVFLNNATSHVTRQDDEVVFQDAKELHKFEQPSGKVDLGLISDNDDDIVSTQNTASEKEAGVHVEVVEDCLSEKKDESPVKQEEPVQESDVQVDSVSQTDSVEGNWGSVSVLSAFSDAAAGAEKASLQPKSDILKLPKDTKTSLEHQNEGETVEPTSNQPNDKANEASGSKKNEEIIAKVTNWSTASGKHQHMSLKSILGGSSSPNTVENPPLKKPQEPEEPGNDGVKGEEWNSPARYPTNIKREKVKVKSKPYWAPFICCSSSNYH